MARVTMKVTATPVTGYKVGDVISVSPAVAVALEKLGKAERVTERAAPRDAAAPREAVAKTAPAKKAAKKVAKKAAKKAAAKKAATYQRRDMKAAP